MIREVLHALVQGGSSEQYNAQMRQEESGGVGSGKS
jgi:hypothetical protein